MCSCAQSQTRLSEPELELSLLGSWSKHHGHKILLLWRMVSFWQLPTAACVPVLWSFLLSASFRTLCGCAAVWTGLLTGLLGFRSILTPSVSLPSNHRELHFPDSLVSAQMCPTQTLAEEAQGGRKSEIRCFPCSLFVCSQHLR